MPIVLLAHAQGNDRDALLDVHAAALHRFAHQHERSPAKIRVDAGLPFEAAGARANDESLSSSIIAKKLSAAAGSAPFRLRGAARETSSPRRADP